jgi:excisionase family DNA binding protein
MSDQLPVVKPPVVQVITLAEFCEPSLYADLIGVSEDTVRGWVESGTLPTVKVGRRRLINRALISDSLKKDRTIFQRGDFADD